MNFEYSFGYTDQNILRMEIKPNDNIKGDLNLLSEWLISDVSCGTTELPKVQEIIQSKSEKTVELWGNAYIATVKKDYTTIKWSILDLPDFCTIPTQMLYEILQIWVKRFKEDWEKINK